MLDMTNTAGLVREALQHELYLSELLEEDLINISALSRTLLPQIKKKNPKATIESISVAIKRETGQGKSIAPLSARIIARSRLAMRNDIIHITFTRDEHVLQRIVDASKNVRWAHEEVFFVNQGPGEITVILDAKNKHLLDECASKRIECTDNLALISIIDTGTPGASLEAAGIYAHFLNLLAKHGVNIIELSSTLSQLTIIVKREELLRGYELLEQNIQYFRHRNI
jgi:aspartokinase